MSRVRRRIKRARRFGVYVFQDWTDTAYDAYSEREREPRGLRYTRRQAANMAHAMTVAKQNELIIAYGALE